MSNNCISLFFVLFVSLYYGGFLVFSRGSSTGDGFTSIYLTDCVLSFINKIPLNLRLFIKLFQFFCYLLVLLFVVFFTFIENFKFVYKTSTLYVTQFTFYVISRSRRLDEFVFIFRHCNFRPINFYMSPLFSFPCFLQRP